MSPTIATADPLFLATLDAPRHVLVRLRTSLLMIRGEILSRAAEGKETIAAFFLAEAARVSWQIAATSARIAEIDAKPPMTPEMREQFLSSVLAEKLGSLITQERESHGS